MLKYVDAKVVFAEVPDEVTLAINISGCPIRCPDCHSKYLWEDVGESLDRDSLHSLIENNKGITCIAFMGGDKDVREVELLAKWVKENTSLKVAWYSGRTKVNKKLNLSFFDYIKLGPFIKKAGPLNNKNTNQKFYRIKNGVMINITNIFWKDD